MRRAPAARELEQAWRRQPPREAAQRSRARAWLARIARTLPRHRGARFAPREARRRSQRPSIANLRRTLAPGETFGRRKMMRRAARGPPRRATPHAGDHEIDRRVRCHRGGSRPGRALQRIHFTAWRSRAGCSCPSLEQIDLLQADEGDTVIAVFASASQRRDAVADGELTRLARSPISRFEFIRAAVCISPSAKGRAGRRLVVCFPRRDSAPAARSGSPSSGLSVQRSVYSLGTRGEISPM